MRQNSSVESFSDFTPWIHIPSQILFSLSDFNWKWNRICAYANLNMVLGIHKKINILLSFSLKILCSYLWTVNKVNNWVRSIRWSISRKVRLKQNSELIFYHSYDLIDNSHTNVLIFCTCIRDVNIASSYNLYIT